MKQLQLTDEGAWVEIKQIELTVDQIAVLTSDDINAQKILNDYIKEQREAVATDADILVGNKKYSEIKPILKDTDIYELISMDVVISGESITGILNCRVNSEHEQIRF